MKRSTEQSQRLFKEASQYIPGGVNSPVRAFRSVGGTPLFVTHANGAYLFDADGNDYVELINSWGPMLFGHAHPVIQESVAAAIGGSFSFGAPTEREINIARKIASMVPSIEKVRLVNSGTEATMSAIRLARGYTGRDKIIKFAGCYHGHGDSFLISAGSGALTFGMPDSQGITRGTAQDTLVVPYNDIDAVRELVDANRRNIAAIILEPVVGNMGCVLPDPGYLQGLRNICDEEGIVLIFDEVMTGFRLSAGGAQELFNIRPDLTTLGKIIGGGLPVGAYGGKKEIMDFVSPLGPVYQAGTLSGNPLATAAGLAMLDLITDDPGIYKALENSTRQITEGISGILTSQGIVHTINRIGSMFTVFFTDLPVRNLDDAKTSDTKLFSAFFHGMLQEGVYMAPSQFEAMFVSTAIGHVEIDRILTSAERVSKQLLSLGVKF